MAYISDTKPVDVHGRPIRVDDLMCLVGKGFSFGVVVGFIGGRPVYKPSMFSADRGELDGLCNPAGALVRIGVLGSSTTECDAFDMLKAVLAEQT